MRLTGNELFRDSLSRIKIHPGQSGRIAVHKLPRAEAEVETLFIRRGDAFVSSALAAFLEAARHSLTDEEAAA